MNIQELDRLRVIEATKNSLTWKEFYHLVAARSEKVRTHLSFFPDCSESLLLCEGLL